MLATVHIIVDQRWVTALQRVRSTYPVPVCTRVCTHVRVHVYARARAQVLPNVLVDIIPD